MSNRLAAMTFAPTLRSTLSSEAHSGTKLWIKRSCLASKSTFFSLHTVHLISSHLQRKVSLRPPIMIISQKGRLALHASLVLSNDVHEVEVTRSAQTHQLHNS
jgi:hypothetical protein